MSELGRPATDLVDVEGAERSWLIRVASHSDVPAVAAGVHRLLEELSGAAPPVATMESAVRLLIDSPASGLVLVADAGGEIVGILGASWQSAIHVPGTYALIQDLWVAPGWRKGTIGTSLLTELMRHADSRNIERVEVGLPREGFVGFEATEGFYARNGFASIGPRMRRTCS